MRHHYTCNVHTYAHGNFILSWVARRGYERRYFDRLVNVRIGVSPRIASIPLSTRGARAQFAAIKPAAFSPSLQTIKGRRNYLKRPLRGSGAVAADYYVSPTTAPLFSPLMREPLCLWYVSARREISRIAYALYATRKIRVNDNGRFINACNRRGCGYW